VAIVDIRNVIPYDKVTDISGLSLWIVEDLDKDDNVMDSRFSYRCSVLGCTLYRTTIPRDFFAHCKTKVHCRAVQAAAAAAAALPADQNIEEAAAEALEIPPESGKTADNESDNKDAGAIGSDGKTGTETPVPAANPIGNVSEPTEVAPGMVKVSICITGRIHFFIAINSPTPLPIVFILLEK
jgi:hypothetical protein